MNKKIIGILVMTLLIITAFPAVISLNNSKINATVTNITQTINTKAIWTETQKLLASDGAAADRFGFSVDLSEDTAIIGAEGDDDNGDYSGSAYVVTRTGNIWTQQAKLLASDGAAGDDFGRSVSIDGDTVIIGGISYYSLPSKAGSVYVFTRIGTIWTQQAKLTASISTANDYFGYSISLDGDTALIGAPGYDNLKGAAYVFTRTGTTWTQQAKLTASDGATGDEFGYSIVLDGNTAFIGVVADDDNGESSGSVYVFTRTGTTWTQQQKLLALDGAAGDWFGISVALDSYTALIGANLDDDMGTDSGSAYVFTRTGTTWTQQAKLTASDGKYRDWFGGTIALLGDTALIGENHFEEDVFDSGFAYVFTRDGTTWTQQQKLLASDITSGDRFGYSIALGDNTAFIGAYNDDDMGTNSGSAYIFTKIENQPPEKPTCNYDKKNDELKVTSTDADDDQIRYGVSWNNNQNVDKWTEFYDSGIEVTINCEGKKGTIGVIAEDIYGAQSDWASQKSKGKSIEYPILNWLLDRFFQRFPFFEKILNQ